MNNFRKLFFQTLQVILALAFVISLKYMNLTQSCDAGSFGGDDYQCSYSVRCVLEKYAKYVEFWKTAGDGR